MYLVQCLLYSPVPHSLMYLHWDFSSVTCDSAIQSSVGQNVWGCEIPRDFKRLPLLIVTKSASASGQVVSKKKAASRNIGKRAAHHRHRHQIHSVIITSHLPAWMAAVFRKNFTSKTDFIDSDLLCTEDCEQRAIWCYTLIVALPLLH